LVYSSSRKDKEPNHFVLNHFFWQPTMAETERAKTQKMRMDLRVPSRLRGEHKSFGFSEWYGTKLFLLRCSVVCLLFATLTRWPTGPPDGFAILLNDDDDTGEVLA